MKRFFSDLNPTVRGFLVIAVIAAVIVALSLESTLTALFLLARIAMLLAIAFFVYLVWRERRADIATWSQRARVTFYGSALLIVADLLAWSFVRLASIRPLRPPRDYPDYSEAPWDRSTDWEAPLNASDWLSAGWMRSEDLMIAVKSADS